MPDTNQPIVEGNTETFSVAATREGEVWDISGGTVTFYLHDPDDNISSFTATIDNGPAGEASYTVADTVLDEPGEWKRQWKISKGGVILRSQQIEFEVLPNSE